MWIPRSKTPDSDIYLAVITSAEALGAAVGIKEVVRNVYEGIANNYPDGIPSIVKVCTHHYEGEGYQLTPVQAHHLNKLELLGEEDSTTRHGYGMTNYSRYFAWRMLDMNKFYSYLEDDTLPAPTAEEREVIN